MTLLPSRPTTRGRGVNPGKHAPPNRSANTKQARAFTIMAHITALEGIDIGPQSHPHALAFAAKAILHTATNPTVTQARISPHWPQWWDAILKELNTLREMHSYDNILKSDIPPDPHTGRRHQIIPTKIDLKIKYDAKGIPIKFKARLVALGNQETHHIIRDVFAPTVNTQTINLMLALAIQNNMHLYGLDITAAFLTADLDEPVYVQLPPNILPPDSQGNPPIWRLRKALYGLSRAPKAFYTQLAEYLLTHHYRRSIHDPCLFYRHYPDGRHIYLCMHVDDIAIAATDQTLIQEFVHTIKTRYDVTESDNLETFLGIQIARSGQHLYLSQPGLLEKMATEANITKTTTLPKSPMPTTFNDDDQDNSPPTDKTKFASLLGMLLFVLRTRPDVAYPVNRLATRASNPTQKDYESLRHIVAYLTATSHYELVYRSNDSTHKSTIAELFAYSDAAYLTHRDSRSHTGVCFTLGSHSGVFHARSQKQQVVTLSSTESELYAATEATKDIIFFRAILAELGHPQLYPTILYVDNKSMITLAQAFSGNHKRVRHFLARIHFMIEQVNNKIITLEHSPGTTLMADSLTKAQPPSRHTQDTLLLLGPQRLKTATLSSSLSSSDT